MSTWIEELADRIVSGGGKFLRFSSRGHAIYTIGSSQITLPSRQDKDDYNQRAGKEKHVTQLLEKHIKKTGANNLTTIKPAGMRPSEVALMVPVVSNETADKLRSLISPQPDEKSNATIEVEPLELLCPYCVYPSFRLKAHLSHHVNARHPEKRNEFRQKSLSPVQLQKSINRETLRVQRKAEKKKNTVEVKEKDIDTNDVETLFNELTKGLDRLKGMMLLLAKQSSNNQSMIPIISKADEIKVVAGIRSWLGAAKHTNGVGR